MDANVTKQMIQVIRLEQHRRARCAAQLADEDPNLAGEEWVFTDEPFVNELCLMLLVAVWHQVEREVIWLAARLTGDGQKISRDQYLKNAQDAQKLFSNRRGRKILEKLKLTSFPEWESQMETLRLLANCYKHDPSRVPNDKLLRHLELDETAHYLPLPESRNFQKGLAAYVHLPQDADYCDIAERLLDCAARFLLNLQKKTAETGLLSTWGPVNFGDLESGLYAG
jgi:hypothetical protein